MPQRIWKYPIPGGSEFEVEMPQGAEVLSVQVQREAPFMWVLIDTERPIEWANFAIVGTGSDIPTDADYVGTFQMYGGPFVGHLFRERRPERGHWHAQCLYSD